MKSSTWVYLGIAMTLVILFGFITLLPLPTSHHLGIPVNSDITIRVDPVSEKKRAKEKEKSKAKENPEATKSPKEKHNEVDKIYTNIANLELLLDNITKSTDSLKKLISSYSLKDAIPVESSLSINSRCVAYNQIKIEDISPYLRSPLWHKNKDSRYVEDRSYLDFLANHYIPTTAPRKYYLDIGAGEFLKSVGWFHDHYPLQFDEVHVFEKTPDLFKIPSAVEIGKQFHDSIRLHELRVDTYDNAAGKVIDFMKWMKEELSPSESDFVVVKIDVEGLEWSLLPKMEEAGLHRFIDELFVSIHYNEPDLESYGWKGYTRTKEEATALLRHWRSLGVYAHYWP